MMKRRVFWRLGCVLVFMILLAGCGNRQQMTEQPGETTGNVQTEAKTQAEVPIQAESQSVPETSTQAQPESETAGKTPAEQEPEKETGEEEDTTMKMNVQVGDSIFTATLEHNAAVDALVEMMESGPVVIRMRDYSGFEKVGSLGTSLPTDNSQTVTQAGDIVLYQGNQIVIFYGSNSWSYTRLGKIDDLSGWEEALGSGDVTVTFSLEG